MRHFTPTGPGPALASLVLAAGLVLAGCGGASSALNPIGGGTGSEAMPSPAATSGPQRADDDGSDLKDSTTIVYTGSLELVVTDLQAALERAQAGIETLGGYVGASTASADRDGNGARATVTYRIPSGRWSDGLKALRALAAEVVFEETSATDVADQLIDLEARLRTLRASETALQDIAAKSAKVTDLLEVERRLTEVRGQIESMDAQRAAIADRAAYGTLVTSFGTDVAAVSQAADEWDPAREVDQATATLLSSLQGLASGLIWFGIVWLPFLAALAVILLLIRAAYRRYTRRHPHADGTGAIPGWGGR